MQKHESFHLNDYTFNGIAILSDHSIHHEKYKAGYIVYEATCKSTKQRVKIYKRPFIDSPSCRRRFFMLIKAFRKGIILAKNIFLSCEKENYYLYTIEPDYSSQREYITLQSLLKKEELDYMKKQKLFQNLLLKIKELHSLGEAHLDLSPKNIWVKDQLEVRLKPFKLDNPSHNITFEKDRLSHGRMSNNLLSRIEHNHSKFWYIAPEQLLNCYKALYHETFTNETESSMHTQTYEKITSDMWSLGCVFAELFVTLTPIFQSVDTTDILLKSFQVLGVPHLDEVHYMNPELYYTLATQISHQHESPLIFQLTENLSKSETQILTSLLAFNPQKRPTPNILLELPFFKAYTPQTQQQKATISLLQILQGSETSALSNNGFSAHKKSRDSLYSAQNSMSRSTYRRQSASRESIGKHRLSEGFARSSSTYNSIPVNHGDWWNRNILETQQGDNHLEKLEKNYRSSSRLDERNHFSSVKKVLDFGESEQTDKNEMETVQTFSDFEQTGHFEMQSPSYFVPKIEESDIEMLRDENRSFRKGQEHWESFKGAQETFDNSVMGKQAYDHNIREPSPSFAFKRHSLMNQEQNFYSTPERSSNKMSGNKRAQERKEEHEEHLQYLQSQKKAPKRAGDEAKAKAKLSVNIETVKVNKPDRRASYGCRVILKSRNSESSTKEKIDLFSCFAPMEDLRVKLDFKGEAELTAESFLQMYSKESLEIQLFYQKPVDRNDFQGVDSEALLYGICKVNLGLALPQLYDSIGKGLPIRARRDWYTLYSPKDSVEIVGQLKLSLSVDFIGNMQQYKNIDHPCPTPQKKLSLANENYNSKQKNEPENFCRKTSIREIDFYSEAVNSSQKKIDRFQNTTFGNMTTDSHNKTFDSSSGKKDVSAFDIRSDNMDVMQYKTLKADHKWKMKANKFNFNSLSQYLEN